MPKNYRKKSLIPNVTLALILANTRDFIVLFPLYQDMRQYQKLNIEDMLESNKIDQIWQLLFRIISWIYVGPHELLFSQIIY